MLSEAQTFWLEVSVVIPRLRGVETDERGVS
jgi:hypothetical protein